jgi:hypothetical protein
MPLPKHDELRIPIMELLSKSGVIKLRDFVEPLAKHTIIILFKKFVNILSCNYYS